MFCVAYSTPVDTGKVINLSFEEMYLRLNDSTAAQQTSAKVLKSLPGDIWRDFGQSGWGPHGDHAFMEFDYGTVARSYPYADQDAAGYGAVEREQNGDEKAQTTSPPTISPRARDLFVDGSCAWTEYYTDRTILEKAGSLYRQDFDLFGWYDLYAWRERLEACLQ